MKCPGCGVNLMSNMKECPKCHYILGTSDGGTKHLIWKNQQDPAYVAQQIEQQKQEKARQEVEQASSKAEVDSRYKNLAIYKLRESGTEGYYEYSVMSLVDESGRTNIQKMAETLNQMGLAGWRLVSSHTNELGKNALMLAGFGINATADETVLIFERFVKL